jgi:hypothetical protein
LQLRRQMGGERALARAAFARREDDDVHVVTSVGPLRFLFGNRARLR